MLQDSKNVQRIKQEAYNVATQTGGEIGSEHLPIPAKVYHTLPLLSTNGPEQHDVVGSFPPSIIVGFSVLFKPQLAFHNFGEQN